MKTTVKDFLGIDIHGSIFVSRSNIESYKGMSSTSPLSLSTTNAMNDLLVAEYSMALIGLFPVCPSPTARLLWVFNCKPFTSAEVFSLSPIPNALQTASFGWRPTSYWSFHGLATSEPGNTILVVDTFHWPITFSLRHRSHISYREWLPFWYSVGSFISNLYHFLSWSS